MKYSKCLLNIWYFKSRYQWQQGKLVQTVLDNNVIDQILNAQTSGSATLPLRVYPTDISRFTCVDADWNIVANSKTLETTQMPIIRELAI